MPESVSRPDCVVDQYARQGSWVIVACGDLDLDSLPPLRQVMEAAATTGPVLVLDTGEVSFADSSALNLLLLMHQTSTLRIAAPPPQLMRLLQTTGADQVLNLYPSVELACQAAKAE